ncbi:MAG: hypothetical protein Q4P28_05855 [Tissierellia bacterium]|nr:hypothetical protein [Tissierellia bacterium]
MRKIDDIIVTLAILFYLILIIKYGDLSRSVFIILMSIIISYHGVQEWGQYVKMKDTFHLVIPIASIVILDCLMVIFFQKLFCNYWDKKNSRNTLFHRLF